MLVNQECEKSGIEGSNTASCCFQKTINEPAQIQKVNKEKVKITSILYIEHRHRRNDKCR